jgi:general secretion pathway protein J
MAAQRMATSQQTTRGFTLIEVLVAISVMALMSLMAWRGLDGMLRSQSSLQARSDEIRGLQAGLAQWQTDLDQLAELSGTPSWDWNGQVLRLTRRTADAPLPSSSPNTNPNPSETNRQAVTVPVTVPASVRVVAWTWRSDPGRPGGGDWQRWQSPPLSQRQDWQSAWALAAQWGQTANDSTRAGQIQIHPLSGWQLFVHRGGSWTNPLSSAAVTSGTPGSPNTNSNPNSNANASATTPDGVRLVLSLPPGPTGSGTLTLDWVRPTLSGAPS